MRVATTTNLAEAGKVGKRMLAFYRRAAEGGAGVLVSEAVRLHPSEGVVPNAIPIFDRSVLPGFRRISDAIHAAGAIFLVQLIHDEAALADALRNKVIAGAGLDVLLTEPPTSDHPLLGFDNVVVSPHIAGITEEALTSMATAAAEQWLEILSGRRPPRLVNPKAWPLYAERFEAILGHRPQ